MSASLTNVFNPGVPQLEGDTLWINRGKDITVSLGFALATEQQNLAYLRKWLLAAIALVDEAIAKEAA